MKVLTPFLALVVLCFNWPILAAPPPAGDLHHWPSFRSSWAPIKRSATETHWRSITVRTNPSTGLLLIRTNAYVEIGAGINVPNGTNFVAANTSFEITAGGAEATGTVHKVSVPADICQGDGIRITQPNGALLVFQPLGIDYYDPTDGRSVLLDAVTNAVGWLTASNEVVFSNCLTRIKSSIRIRNFPWGIESDLILHERPEAPEIYGLSGSARLEMLTEQFEGNSPETRARFIHRERDPVKIATMVEPHFLDSELTFGAMKMGMGKAFAISSRTNRGTSSASPVGKSFELIQKRRIIIEAVEHRHAARSLNRLPAATETGVTNAGVTRMKNGNVAAITRRLPTLATVSADRAEKAARTASIKDVRSASSGGSLLASADADAFVLD